MSNNVLNAAAQQLSEIDEDYNAQDGPLAWNARLRAQIAQNFCKELLTPDQVLLFRAWQERVTDLPLDAARLAIFSAACMQSLNIVGV